MVSSQECSNNRWYYALECNGDGLWDWNYKTNVVYFSPQWKTMLGYTEEEIKNDLKEWEKRVHPEDLEQVYEKITRYINGFTERYESVHRIQCKNGKFKWILDRGQIVERDSSGAPLRFIGTHTDITSQKLLEEKYSLQSKRLEIINTIIASSNQLMDVNALLELSLKSIINLLNFEGGCAYIVEQNSPNAHLKAAINLPKNYRDSELIINIHQKPFSEVFIENKIHIDTNYHLTKPNESGYKSFYIIPIVSRDAVIGALNVVSRFEYLSVSEDLSVLKSIGEELGNAIRNLENEQKMNLTFANLRTFFNSIHDLFFVFDQDGTIQDINQKVVERLGYTREEIIGVNIIDLHLPERRNDVLQNLMNITSGKLSYCDVPLVAKSGEIIQVETIANSGFWSGRAVTFGVTRDTGDRLNMEQELKSIVEAFPDLIFRLDNSGIILSHRAGNSSDMYVKEAQFLGKKFEDVLPESAALSIKKAFDKLKREGGVQIVEYDLTISQEVNSYECRMIQASKNNIIAIVRNITIRRKALNAVIVSQARQKAVLDNLPFLAWLKNKEGRFEAVNEPFARKCGLTVENVIGKTDFDVWPKDLAEKYTADDKLVMDSGKKMNKEEEVQDNKGRSWFETYKTPIFNDKCDVIGTTGFTRDISERKNLEDTLKRKDDLLIAIAQATDRLLAARDIKEALPFCLEKIGLAVNVDRTYIFQNRKEPHGALITTQTYEWVNNPAIGMMNSPYVTDLPLDSIPAFYETGLKKQPFFGIVRNLDQTLREALEPQNIKSILIIPIHLKNEFWGFVGFDDCQKERIWSEAEKNILVSFAASISAAIERATVEEDLINARITAESSNQSKSTFLANMSHELRTPLNAIIGISKMLWKKNSENLNSRQTEGLGLVYDSGIRLLNLINDILDMAKIESGKMQKSILPVQVKTLIKTQYDTIKPLIDSSQIDFQMELADTIPEFIATDEMKLGQVLTNILANAAKFTEKGFIRIKADWKNSVLNILIEDSGIGIEHDELDRVFDKFYQSDHSLSRKYKGTGLGLPLSLDIMRLIGGDIKVESILHQGTKIFLTLPSTEVTPSEFSLKELQPNQVPYERRKKKKVLIAEDESINRTAIKMMLEDRFEIFFAVNGKEVIELFPQIAPDIILMDIMMPEVDGLTAFNQIRLFENGKSTPVIAVTARVMPEEKKAIGEAGFNGYIAKPIDDQLLIALIEKLLEKKDGSI